MEVIIVIEKNFLNRILVKYLVPLRYLDVTFRFNIDIYTCEQDVSLYSLQRLMIGLKLANHFIAIKTFTYELHTYSQLNIVNIKNKTT